AVTKLNRSSPSCCSIVQKNRPPVRYSDVLRVALAYAYGNPRTMDADTAGAFQRRMAFITANGLPWENDPLYDRERRMIQQQQADEALALEAAKNREANPAASAVQDQKDKFDLGEERLELVPGDHLE